MEEYKIPKDIEEKIPNSFYIALGGELTSIFGLDVWHVADGVRGADYIAGSAGVCYAIKMVCQKLNMMWLYDYYDQIPWYESDQFDGIVIDRAFGEVSKGCRLGYANPYYLYLVTGKEWGDEIR